MFQIMIVIRNLLDACGISYTDKQLAKLDKLFDELLKKLILQQYDFDETTQQHDSTLDYEQNASKEEFPNNTKLKPFQHCIEELEIKPEPQNENAIKEEIAEEGLTEIKEEFSNDPFAPLEMLNNCKIISITPYKCSVCQITFVSHEEVLEHACVQSNEKKS